MTKECKDQLRRYARHTAFYNEAERFSVAKGNCPYWVHYGSNIRECEERVDMPIDTLHEMIDAQRKKDKPLRVLDVMSDLSCIRSLNASGIAIGLYDDRTLCDRKQDLTDGRYMLEGSIFNGKIWRNTRNILYETGMDYVDVVLEFGTGALYDFPDADLVLWSSMNRGYELLDPRGGVMCLEIPGKSIFMQKAIEYADYINHKHQGISVSVKGQSICVEKNYGSPQQLPG